MTEKVLIIPVPVLAVDNLPYGPAVVSGILRNHGYVSTVWDLNIDLYHQFTSRWHVIVAMLGNRAYRPSNQYDLNIQQVLSTIRRMLRHQLQKTDPNTIMLSVFSSQSLDLVIALTTMIKQMRPDCYLLVGGRGIDNLERFTGLNYAEFYSQYLPVDCWYLGDAENNLIPVLERKFQGIFRSPPVTSADIDNVPAAAWHGYELHKYQGYDTNDLRMPITGSKGCVRQCTFCDVAGSWPKFVYRQGQSIAQEMIDFYRTTGLSKFEFTDNLINGSIKYFRDMNSYIAAHEPNVFDYKGYAICRPKNEFPASDFALARTAGATTFKVGIESGSEQVRFDMKKKFSNQDITWFAENCHDQGIRQIWLMFVGYPTETEQDFQHSIDLLRQHQHLTGDGMIKVHLSLPMMLTSSSSFMRLYSDDYGIAHNAQDAWGDFFWTSSKFKDNTFDVRAERWHRFIAAINQFGYVNESTRQSEKILEIEGIEKIYKDHYQNGKKIIPINSSAVNVNKESHI